MSEDANEVQETTPEVVDAPESQPAEASDTPAAPEQRKPEPAPQSGQQPPDHVPYWRLKELADQNRALKAQLSQQAPQQPNQQPNTQAAQAPKPEDFPTYEDFLDARAEFRAKEATRKEWAAIKAEEQQAQRVQAEQTRAQSAESNWSQRASEAAAKYPDFEQKISTVAPLNPVAQAVLKASPMAGDLAYHLAAHPELIDKLNGMHPLDQAAEMGRIEGKLTGTGGQPKVSQMPKPMTPINGGKSNAGGGSGLDKALSVLYPNS